MDKKIITLLIILLFTAGIAYAADNTTSDEDFEDTINYIVPVSISQNGIEFSDGFIGFSIDSDDLTTSDEFTSEPTGNDELQNYIKLAIIECYKQSREDDIGEIVASFCDGSYANSDDELITAVLDSSDEIGNHAVVELYDESEATFDFELLKSSEDKSDCIAYKVSIDESSSQDNVLGASDSEVENVTDTDNVLGEADNNDTADENEATTTNDASDPVASDDSNNNTPETAGEDNNTEINETNKTIVNKTNTVIVHEKNTTVITKNNVKNDTPQDAILKTAGNPLFILVVVAAIIAVAVFEKYRRG